VAVYAIGDVQGCYTALQRLLAHIAFDPTQDRLWLVGDLVNRGPESAACLRFLRGLGSGAVTSVLGNHDLYLLAVVAGLRRKRRDTLDDVLNAPDRSALIDWLRHRPLIWAEAELGWAMVHAGLPPEWSFAQAQAAAGAVEARLRASDWQAWLPGLFGNEPRTWHQAGGPVAGQRFTVNALTRMRYCDAESGALDFDHTGPPGTQPVPLQPWYRGRSPADGMRLVFGHWSALGGLSAAPIYGVDTGCVWGGRLTALRLDTLMPAWYSVACPRSTDSG